MSEEFTAVRTTTENPIYIHNCELLDAELDEKVGAETEAKYKPFLIWQGDVIIVYRGEKPIGSGGIRKLSDSVGEYKRFYVVKDERGKGVLHFLIHSLEDWARDLGYTSVRFETDRSLTYNIELYRSLGYCHIPSYGPYTDMPDSYCVEKIL